MWHQATRPKIYVFFHFVNMKQNNHSNNINNDNNNVNSINNISTHYLHQVAHALKYVRSLRNTQYSRKPLLVHETAASLNFY